MFDSYPFAWYPRLGLVGGRLSRVGHRFVAPTLALTPLSKYCPSRIARGIVGRGNFYLKIPLRKVQPRYFSVSLRVLSNKPKFSHVTEEL